MFASSSFAAKKHDFEIYNGLSDPVEFFRQFELHCFVHDWDDTKSPLALKLFVSGKAEDEYDRLVSSGKTAYLDIKKGIIDACKPSKELKLQMFYSRKMQNDESVLSYYQALRSLFKKAMDSKEKPEELEVFVQSQLINNVPLEFKATLKMASCMGSEAFNKLILTMNGTRQQVSESLGLSEPENIVSNAINARPGSNRVMFDGDCLNCGVYGHRIAFCPEPIRRNRNNSYGNNNNNNASNSQSRGGGGGGSSNRTNYNNASSNKYNNNYTNSSSPQQYQYSNNRDANQNKYGSHANNNNRLNVNAPSGYKKAYANVIDSNNTLVNDGKTDANNNNNGSNSSNNDQLPFSFADFCTIELAEFNSLERTNLLFVNLMVKSRSGCTRELRALFDGGSTHSFLSPYVFDKNTDEWVVEVEKNKEFTIRGAMSTSRTECDVAKVDCSIGTWNGQHQFVIASSVSRYEAVVGRDFFRLHNVTIKHGTNEVMIDGLQIPLASIETNGSENWNASIHDINVQTNEMVNMVNNVKSLQSLSDDLLAK